MNLEEKQSLSALIPNLTKQIRNVLTNLHISNSRLVSPAEREKDPELDLRAAYVDRDYYRLLRLVGNLTLAAQLDQKSPQSLKNCDLAELVVDLCQQTASLATYCGLELHFSCPMEHLICATDRELVTQILLHLLSNAMRFTPKGGEIRVALQSKGNRILISVEDTGCGISAEALENLFFYGSGLSYHGIGLPLCHQLAQSLGGVLVAQSTLGTGSCFTLCLPKQTFTGGLADVHVDYTGGFNRFLLALSDALPVEAFLIRSQD